MIVHFKVVGGNAGDLAAAAERQLRGFVEEDGYRVRWEMDVVPAVERFGDGTPEVWEGDVTAHVDRRQEVGGPYSEQSGWLGAGQ